MILQGRVFTRGRMIARLGFQVETQASVMETLMKISRTKAKTMRI